MPSKDYFFPFLYQKFLSSTLGWKDDEVGAYLRLLIHQYERGHIPESMDALIRIAPSAKKNWTVLSDKFVKVADGRLVNEVMNGIRSKRLQKSETASENGKRGGRPKKPTETETKADGFQIQNQQHKQQQMVNGSVSPASDFEGVRGNFSDLPVLEQMKATWLGINKDYPFSTLADYSALFSIGEFLSKPLRLEWLPENDIGEKKLVDEWNRISAWILNDHFYKNFSLTSLSKTTTLQTIWQKSNDKNGSTTHQQPSARSKRNAGAYAALEDLKNDFARGDGENS